MEGDAFRQARLRLRLSQGELKDELNHRLGRSYDKPKVSRWENGREPVPEDVGRELEAMAAGSPMSARVVVFANQKGGVGKTTSALNVCSALSQAGMRVLLVDMDPQATATMGLLAAGAVEAYRQGRVMSKVILGGASLPDVILRAGEAVGSDRPLSFDLAASHIELAETDGKREPGFDAALREALETCRGAYEFVVVDAPPNLGMLTWMALAAADEAIIPVRTEPYDSMGVGLILQTINKVQRRLNPGLRLSGILPTQYAKRKSVDREVLAHLVASLGEAAPVLEPIPDSAAFGHAARNGQIVVEASGNSAPAQVYVRLAAALASGGPLPRAAVPEPEAAEA